MKKLLLALCSIFFFTQINHAQTEVSGGLFSATTWTLAESPYIVTSDVVVFPDASLTIEPGVEVRFYSNTRLELRAGDLYATGTAEQPISFTLDAADPTSAEKWNGIENTSTEDEAITIELDYVIFEYAKTAIHYGKGYANRSINNAVFRFNDRGAFDGAQGYNWVTISNTTFTANGVGMEGRMSAMNCTFQENEVGFGNPMTFADINSGGRVTNCTFTNNELAIGTIGQIITIAIIENSTFTNNEKGYFGYWANIDNSIFTNSSEVGVSVTKGDIRNSSFTENEIGLQVSLFPSSLNIYDNFFGENNAGLEIGGAGAEIYENTICNNIQIGARLTTDQPVDLNLNCWCTSNLDEIAGLITDAYDDVTLGIASYENINTACIGGLVFPGDGNNDGQVNNSDLLGIGLAYGIEGALRIDGTTNWVGQTAEDWAYTMPNGVNAKHADANGDGVINDDDLAIIEQNYGGTHNYLTDFNPVFVSNESYDLAMSVDGVLEAGSEITVDLSFANTSSSIANFYGFAFTLASEQIDFSQLDVQVNTSNAILGTSNVLRMQRPTESGLEFAMVRNNQEGVTGNGLLASIRLTLPEDFNTNALELSIVNIEAINSAGFHLQINELEEVFTVTSLGEIGEEWSEKISLFPNPARSEVNLSAPESTISEIQLINAKGQLAKVYNGQQDRLDLSALNSGFYYLQIVTEKGIASKRLIILEN